LASDSLAVRLHAGLQPRQFGAAGTAGDVPDIAPPLRLSGTQTTSRLRTAARGSSMASSLPK
jgi:hypothetical protein